MCDMNDIMVIGIAGGTGSGKTTITKKLMQRFGGDVDAVLFVVGCHRAPPL